MSLDVFCQDVECCRDLAVDAGEERLPQFAQGGRGWRHTGKGHGKRRQNYRPARIVLYNLLGDEINKH